MHDLISHDPEQSYSSCKPPGTWWVLVFPVTREAARRKPCAGSRPCPAWPELSCVETPRDPAAPKPPGSAGEVSTNIFPKAHLGSLGPQPDAGSPARIPPPHRGSSLPSRGAAPGVLPGPADARTPYVPRGNVTRWGADAAGRLGRRAGRTASHALELRRAPGDRGATDPFWVRTTQPFTAPSAWPIQGG